MTRPPQDTRAEDDEAAPSGPLAGVVVADFSRVLAGPYATMLLADLGATVVKVESPGGDDTREWRPPVRDGVSTYYLSVNRNKRSIALNLKDPEDLATAHRLVGAADVFIENFKPGGLAKFGLDPESVAERWPRLVHASITGFGTAGGANLPGYDMLVQATSGLMTITGAADGPPQKAGVAIFDVITGLHAAVGILAALREREASGKGQHIALNLQSSALSGLVNAAGAVVAGGVEPRRLGNIHPSLFPYGPFAAADREVVIACGNDAQFGRLVAALGAPGLAADERFATMEQRNAHRGDLQELLEERLAAGTADEWTQRLREVGVPAAPIMSIGEGVAFAEELGLNPVVDACGVPTVADPMGFSRTPVDYRLAPPAVDEHRAEILAWLAKRESSTAADTSETGR